MLASVCAMCTWDASQASSKIPEMKSWNVSKNSSQLRLFFCFLSLRRYHKTVTWRFCFQSSNHSTTKRIQQCVNTGLTFSQASTDVSILNTVETFPEIHKAFSGISPDAHLSTPIFKSRDSWRHICGLMTRPSHQLTTNVQKGNRTYRRFSTNERIKNKSSHQHAGLRRK